MASVTQGAFIAVAGVDLSGVLTKITTPGTSDLKDATTLGDTVSKKYQKGLVSRMITGEGFFRKSGLQSLDTQGLLDTALANSSSDYLALIGKDGSSVGDPAILANLSAAKLNVDVVEGELLRSSFEGQVTKTTTAGSYQYGVFLMNQTVTTTTNGTTYDTTSGGTGYLIQIHILTTSAIDSQANVKVQHSVLGSVWVDLVSAANYDESTATQLSSTATSVNRYVRAVAGPGDASAVVAVAIKVGYTG